VVNAWRGSAALLIGLVYLGCTRQEGVLDSRIHLKYWAVWSGFELETMRDVVSLFNQSQDKIWVDLLSISQLERKLLVATSGGNPPDIASLSHEFLPDFSQKNALIPLDGFLARSGISRDDFIPVYWDQCLHEGYTWAVPIMGAAMALHYNRAHFREAGLDPDKPPVTFDELRDCSEKINLLKDGQYERIAFMPSVSIPDWWPFAWPWFFGGDLWNGVDRLTLTDPVCIEAYQWVADYVTRLGAKRIQNLRAGFGNLFASPQNPFLAGKLTMLFQGSWMANFVDKYAPELDFGVAPMCVKSPDLYGTALVEADAMFIPKGTRYPEASFEFLKFVISQKANEQLCLGFRCISTRKARSEAFLEKHPNPNFHKFDELVKGNKTHFSPKMSMWYEMMDEMGVVFDQVWLHEKTPLQALTDAQNRLQPRLDQEIEQWKRVKEQRRQEWDRIVDRTRRGEPLE
jgi:ABC-type glycerol-3-phosphate transport system substrate-binding protein